MKEAISMLFQNPNNNVFTTLWTGMGDRDLYTDAIRSFREFHPESTVFVFTDSTFMSKFSSAQIEDLKQYQNKLAHEKGIVFLDMATLVQNSGYSWMGEHIEPTPYAFMSDVARFEIVKHLLNQPNINNVVFFEADVICKQKISFLSEDQPKFIRNQPNDDVELLDIFLASRKSLPTVEKICSAFDKIGKYIFDTELLLHPYFEEYDERGETIEAPEYRALLEVFQEETDLQKIRDKLSALKVKSSYLYPDHANGFVGESFYSEVKYENGKLICTANPSLALGNPINIKRANKNLIELFTAVYFHIPLRIIKKEGCSEFKFEIEHVGKREWDQEQEFEYKELHSFEKKKGFEKD